MEAQNLKSQSGLHWIYLWKHQPKFSKHEKISIFRISYMKLFPCCLYTSFTFTWTAIFLGIARVRVTITWSSVLCLTNLHQWAASFECNRHPWRPSEICLNAQSKGDKAPPVVSNSTCDKTKRSVGYQTNSTLSKNHLAILANARRFLWVPRVALWGKPLTDAFFKTLSQKQ